MQSNSTKLPSDWTKVAKVSTRSELLEVRKQSRLPDISFDLDGDGTVGGKDYLIAKRFDLDQDGKLGPEERMKAKAGLADLENSLLWGCDSLGNNKGFRIIQKRGNVIVNEDFAEVAKSYPAFPAGPAGEEKPIRSKTDLQAKRKEEVRLKGKFYEAKMQAEYWREVKDEKQAERAERDERGEGTCAGLGYREEPRFRTRAEMVDGKKKQLVRTT